MPKDIDVRPVFDPGKIEIDPVPLFVWQGDLKQALEQGLSREDALNAYRCMLYIRSFEEMVVQLKQGRFKPMPGFKFVGATHLSIGQEAVAAGGISAIRPTDFITSTHRGHGHSIAKGYYALLARSPEELVEFIGGVGWEASPDDPDLLEKAIQVHLNRTMAELLGKEEGYCRGRGGGMHIADFHAGHLGANAIVGGSIGIGTGAAMGLQKLGTDSVVLCLFGDGAANNGICHESMNFGAMAQFKRGTPVIYLIENNQYGMTGQQVGEVTGIRHLARRGASYNHENLHAEVVNGMDVVAVRDAVTRAAELCRQGQGPVLLECLTYRFMGHSLSDDRTTYRSKQEEEMWQAWDPIDTFERQAFEAGLLTEEEAKQYHAEAAKRIHDATNWAGNEGTDPEPSTIYEGLLTDTNTENLGPEWATPRSELLTEPQKQKRDGQGRILYRHAIAEALMEEMLRDRRVILYGEDVADYGGAFGATRGLIEIFGRERVFNTAISEAAIIGTGCGAAMVGMRPVVEIMYIDFILMTMDQLGNQVAKSRYMFGGKMTIPLVVRTSIGGGKGYAGQHSQSLEAVVCMFPGLKVIAPATAYDAKGLLKAAIRDDNPVVFIEHQLAYLEKDVVPEDDYTVPIGVAKVAREGTDVTIVAYSYMYYVAMKAAEMAAEEGISVEVVDPRTLVPLDLDTLAGSVRKTGRAVILQQAPEIGCYGKHIAQAITEQCWGDLKAPVRVVAAHNVPPPMAQPLEQENIPSPEKVLRNIHELLEQ
ncbi:MAG: dehydrogenase E1 component subunit alpha/beta [Armatimonadetes bacterium]|nr:dehydrogenase E1 component subunit alpha/beta [Armatimonadota bacterium]